MVVEVEGTLECCSIPFDITRQGFVIVHLH